MVQSSSSSKSFKLSVNIRIKPLFAEEKGAVCTDGHFVNEAGWSKGIVSVGHDESSAAQKFGPYNSVIGPQDSQDFAYNSLVEPLF
jgi:hypothetical protein